MVQQGCPSIRVKGKLPGHNGTQYRCKSKLDGKEPEIRILLHKQVSKASIAKILDISRIAMQHFINSRQLAPNASQPQSRAHRP